MKTYHGKRVSEGTTHVWIEEDDTKRAIRHMGRHSPTGFEWGYGGSGPSDLAFEIVSDVLGQDADPDVYMKFKFDVLAPLQADEWSMSEIDVRQALMNSDPNPEPLTGVEKEVIVALMERELAVVNDRIQTNIGGEERERIQTYGQLIASIWDKMHD